eukprot:scaffold3831_cov112-Isochrysis_galbana.AAC.2
MDGAAEDSASQPRGEALAPEIENQVSRAMAALISLMVLRTAFVSQQPLPAHGLGYHKCSCRPYACAGPETPPVSADVIEMPLFDPLDDELPFPFPTPELPAGATLHAAPVLRFTFDRPMYRRLMTVRLAPARASPCCTGLTRLPDPMLAPRPRSVRMSTSLHRRPPSRRRSCSGIASCWMPAAGLPTRAARCR